MKNFLFLFALLVSGSGLKAQISTFDIDQKTLVYINYMPGDGPGYDYNYSWPSDFTYQWNDLLEVGAILPVWNNLNANVGIGATLGHQDAELWQIADYNPGTYPTMGTGLHLKSGVSYSLQIGGLQIMPNVGVVFNTETGYYWERLGENAYQLTET